MSRWILAVFAVAIVVVGAVVGMVLILTPAEPVALSPTPAPSAASATLTAEQYYVMVRQDVPSLADRPDANLDQIASTACDYFRSNGTWLGLVKMLTEGGLSGYEAGKMGPYIVYRACPDQAGKLPSH
jgi:hypothetical protein